MVDTLSPVERSERMSHIRSRDTAPEFALRRALHARGLRYRLHGATLPGRPDIVFPSPRVAVFVHGCFWPRHEGCRIATTPKSNTPFWQAKFMRNIDRDLRNSECLVDLGWKVLWSGSASFLPPAKAMVASTKVAELIQPAARSKRKD